jgi:hypothetical protein
MARIRAAAGAVEHLGPCAVISSPRGLWSTAEGNLRIMAAESGDRHSEQRSRRARSARRWYWLLLLPFAALVYPPLYSHDTARLTRRLDHQEPVDETADEDYDDIAQSRDETEAELIPTY